MQALALLPGIVAAGEIGDPLEPIETGETTRLLRIGTKLDRHADSEAVQDRFHQIDHVVVVVDHHHSQSREPKVRHAGNFDLSENVTCVLLAYN